MQGKTKSFLEDTVIVIVVIVLAYSAYMIYDTYSDKESKNINKIEVIQEENNVSIEQAKENIINKIMRYIQKASTSLEETNTEKEIPFINDEEVDDNENNTTVDNKILTEKPQENMITQVENNASKKMEVPEKTIEEKKVPKVILKKIEKPIVVKTTELKVLDNNISLEEKEEKKVKNVDLVMLRSFMRDLKFKIANNIVKRDDLNATVSQELQIRITVLEDGNYEQLTFVSGDEVLFEMNKENIANVFPVNIDDKIKEDFPRYVRLNLK